MSVFIGDVKGPRHNSPRKAADVWCSPGQVELNVWIDDPRPPDPSGVVAAALSKTLDPIAARNLAALLVRASEEAERMAPRREREMQADRDTVLGRTDIAR